MVRSLENGQGHHTLTVLVEQRPDRSENSKMDRITVEWMRNSAHFFAHEISSGLSPRKFLTSPELFGPTTNLE